jgi:transmembrane sensor
MKNTRAEALMAAYLSGNIGIAEQEELLAWAAASPEGQKFFDKALELWRVTDQMAYPDFSAGKSIAWNRLEDRLAKHNSQLPGTAPTPRGGIVRRLGLVRWAAAAAVLALVLGAWWYTTQANTQLLAQTGDGERTQVELPDGTRVWLNENSSLAYDERSGERLVTFVGEAFFDVATDSLRPFRVLTGDAVTTVLGTSFNLRAYAGEERVEVSVKEGKVALERKSTPTQAIERVSRLELTPGQTGIFDEETTQLETAPTPDQNTTAWMDRRLDFNEVPLAQVVATLERYYHVDIVLQPPGLGKCLFFGQYENDPQLEMVLLLLTESLGLELQQNGNSYRLSGDSCD